MTKAEHAVSHKDEIMKRVRQRNISHLFHFTPAQNMPSIIEHGLLPRKTLIDRKIPAWGSDRLRLEEREETTSISISGYNFAMLMSKLDEDPWTNWIVLHLDASILWTNECRFCWRNAAHASMRGRKHDPLNTVENFEFMFSDEVAPDCYSTAGYRAATGLPLRYTSRPDAEVQVYGKIPADLIIGATVTHIELAHAVDRQLKRLSGAERMVDYAPFAPSFKNNWGQWG